MKNLRVEWMEHPSYVDGGCYILVKANGQIFAELAQKGRNETARKHAVNVCSAYNVAKARQDGRI